MSPGFTADGLQHWRAAAERHVGNELVPGLVSLIARGDEVHVHALGTLAIGGRPVARDSIFRIASTTKPITAAATLALVQEGLITLDEPVERLLPELAERRVLRRMDGPLQDTLPATRAITARDLLTFTFGFGMVLEMFAAEPPWPVVAAAEELRLATLGPPEPAVQPDPDTWIASLGRLPLLAQPGERWLYNTGASVLGVLLARAAGQPLAEVLRTRVFEPLGMRDTAFWSSDDERLATAYRPTPEGLVRGSPARPGADRPSSAMGRPVSSRPPMTCWRSRACCSTSGAPVLSAEHARAMTTDQLTAAQKAHGGLGPDFFAERSWGFGQAVLADGAFGWDGGLGTTWLVDPSRDLTIIVLTQRLFETPQPPQVHRDIQAAAYAALA